MSLPLASGFSEEYTFPWHSLMMDISVASNGSFAIAGITLSEYGKIPDQVCPIDSPDTYIGCRDLSRREYLIVEIGDGVRYVNATAALKGFNFTAISVAPVGKRWFIVGVKQGASCEFGVCPNASYTVMEYFPGEDRIGRPVRIPWAESQVLFHLPDAISAGGGASNGSLVFSFSYAGENYSVPTEALGDYLELLNFTDSSGLTNDSLLKLFRAVPFRGGVLLYLPGYGLEPYTPEPYSFREYLLVQNEFNLYSSFDWVGHSGFVCLPDNGTPGNMTKGIFPPLLYYRGGGLIPVMNISVEAFNRTLEDGERFLFSWPVMEIRNESRAEFGGSSSPPEFKLPENKGVYLSLLKPMPHYSPNNMTLIDFYLNSNKCIHAEFENGSLTYLKIPFPGLFHYLNGRWLYQSMDAGSCPEFCIYMRTPRYNRTFVYNPAEKTLIPQDSWNLSPSLSGETPKHINQESGKSIPLSDCTPTPEATKMLKKVRVGDGFIFYYPAYAPEVSILGHETVVLRGSYDSATRARLNETCILFYSLRGNVTFALRLRVVPVNVSVGMWKVELGVPYLDTSNSLNVSVEASESTSTTETPGGGGICGPALLAGLSIIPALIRRHR
ncbi:CGP-CTERM sorting domain-containing protein [Thermococcus sp.]|uniref:CGP-CTERM sorting domain-containing protein n=1 Tax=Thermococcus sp. TaxID=35749 RepID=UPI0026399280|nr:CGP-CTERM sorting domain-containing protein [Thermococcus sp.]